MLHVQTLKMNSVPPRSLTGAAVGLTVAGAATLAVAEVASSADFAGAASPADLAGMAIPAVAGIEFPADVGASPLTDVAEGAFPADAEGGGGRVTSAVCLSEPLRAVAEVDPLIVVEMASSTDLRGPTGSSGTCTPTE